MRRAPRAAARASGEPLWLRSLPPTQGHMPWPRPWKRGPEESYGLIVTSGSWGGLCPLTQRGSSGAFRKGAPRKKRCLPLTLG